MSLRQPDSTPDRIDTERCMCRDAERVLSAWEQLGESRTMDEVIRLILDWAEARVAAHDLSIKSDAYEVAQLARRIEVLGVKSSS